MTTAVTDAIPYLEWNEFLRRFQWRQGEHVTLIGPTGAGKTTLALEILPKRKYVCVLATKPKDDTLDKLQGEGYRIVRDLPLPSPVVSPRIVFWPDARTIDTIPEQHRLFRDLLANVYRSGGWTIYCDEVQYLTGYLKLEKLTELLWRQGRSLNVSLVSATQRPRHIPLSAYSQATHIFSWRNPDKLDVFRVSGIGFVDPAQYAIASSKLGRHDVLYANAYTGEVIRTNTGGGT